jgi:hypothetical protein
MEKSKEKGWVNKLEGVDEEEASRVVMKASQEQILPPPPETPSRYDAKVMPLGLRP